MRISRISSRHLKLYLLMVLRFCFLFGLCFIILYPFLAKVSSVFMSKADLRDPIVWMIPRTPTLSNIRNVIIYGNFWNSLFNTTAIALSCAILQTISATLVAYGLAKFKFKGKGILIALIVLTIVVPPQTIYVSMYMKFRFLDWFGILEAISLPTLNLLKSVTPLLLLSSTCLGLKSGLFILVLIQQFRSVPKELSEAAFVDGAGTWRTFLEINVPQARAMMVSVFLLSFAWQWTDTFYTGLFLRNTPVLPNVVFSVQTITAIGAVGGNGLSATMGNTAVVMMLVPLVIVYLIGQRALIQGIERSGLVG